MSTVRRSGDLPALLSPLFGREAELAELEASVDRQRLVTVVGVAGVGKTRLAVEVARRAAPRLPAGTWMVDLAPLTPGRVRSAVAGALGVAEAASAPFRLVAEVLGDERGLVLLDSCEHVLDDVVAVVRELTAACPTIHVLATSREPLAVAGEVTLPLAPLASEDAAQLFAERASAAMPGADVQASDAGVREMCERLDHLPLAIELAAPWVRVFGADGLAVRLRSGFVPVSRRRDVPPRHRTMRDAVAWSDALLPEPARVLLRRLALFHGGSSVDAVEAVTSWEPLHRRDVPMLLATLSDASLLVTDSSVDGVRYRMLDAVREHAAERLDAAGERDIGRGRHLDHLLDVAEAADARWWATASERDVVTLATDVENVRAALSWAVEAAPEKALRLVGALEGLWMLRWVDEGRRWVERTLARCPERSRARARALIVSPFAVAGALPWAEARASIDESIAIFTAMGDRTGAALAAATGALSAFFHGDTDAALASAEDTIERYADVDAVLFRVRSTIYLGVALVHARRRAEDGQASLQRGLDLAVAAGDGWGAVLARTVLGLAAARAGQGEVAFARLREALVGPQRGGVTAAAVGGLGALCAGQDRRRAVLLLEGARVVAERAGVPRFPPPIAQQLDHAHAAATAHVAADVVGRWRASARAMTTDELVDLALAAPAAPAGGEPGRDAPLTPRQWEVVRLVADGLTNREAAERLRLSVRTVDKHVENAMAALGARRRAQLATWVLGNEASPT